MDTHFNSGLSVREHASHVLHVGDLLAWAKSQGLHICCTPPMDGFKFVQVEAFLCAIERYATDVTPDDAHRIVQNDPALKNSPAYADFGDPSFRAEPGFSKWVLQSTAHTDWRKRLNIAFAAGELRLLDFGSKLPIEFTPTQSAETATTVVDPHKLASRDQLIAVFGAFTGMDKTWFDNLKDTPALLAARKVDGVGARGSTRQPLFCPFEVMAWLADKKRKKGRPFHNEYKPWDLLEQHFPVAYEAHSEDDPRQYRPG